MTPRGRPLQQRAHASRKELLNAAGAEFAERGYAAATMQGVVSRTGLTTGALTFHFSGKEDLALAVIEAHNHAGHQVRKRFGSVIDRKDPLATLIAMSHEWCRLLAEDSVIRGGVRLTMDRPDLAGDSDDPFSPHRVWIEQAQSLLQRAVQQGELLPSVEASEEAEYLVEHFTGMQVLSNATTDHADLWRRCQRMWRHELTNLVAPQQFEKFFALLD